ncbi:MAG TPA: trigger factor [Acidimicrobiales bacterium]|nr:trigger factor [Acidimicrobiales bacterium]
MRTTVEPLEGNKIKLTVEIDGEEVAEAERQTLNRLTKQARIPGFRPGKVPRRLLEARLGQKAIREEALRDALPRYYGDAVKESELDVIASPKIDITAGEESGPISFDAVVEVRPEVAIPGHEGLVVTVPSPLATDEEVDAQIDRMREQFATLTEVARPAKSGDVVTLDVHGSRDGKPAEGLVADDLVYELGTGGIADGVDAKVLGAKVGDIFELDADDTPGGPAHLRILVKQVREKVLPAADDAFAQDASEFETLDELRADLRSRIGELKRRQGAQALRVRSLDALGELVAEELPTTLVANEAQRLLDDFVNRLAQQQIPLATYLEATGTDQEALFHEFEEQARRDVRADLALRALAVAENIEVDESELDEEVVHLAGHAKTTPAKMRSTIERGGGLAGLRSQIKSAKALRWLIEHVDIVDEEGNPVERSMLLEGEEEAGHPHDDPSAMRSDLEEESK